MTKLHNISSLITQHKPSTINLVLNVKLSLATHWYKTQKKLVQHLEEV